MARTPSGTVHSVATVLASAKSVTAVTNAAEAVCSSTAHGFIVGDIVLMFSGWSGLNLRPLRVKAVPTVDSFTLESFDTSNTTVFPAGLGAGSAQKVTTWVELVSTMNHASSGGDAKPVTFQFLENDQETTIVDGATAVQRTFEMDADQLGSAGYNALKTLSASRAMTILRRRARSGAVTLISGTVFFSEEEKLNPGNVVTVGGAFYAQSPSIRYAS